MTTSVPRRTPAVHEDEAAPRDSLHDLRKSIEARLRAVELAATVIRDHDAVDAVLAGELRVLFREDPLHEEREGRDRAQPFQVAPGHRRIDDLAQRGVEVPAPEVIREVGEGEVCGNLERGADVALPSSRRGEIDGEDDRLEAGIRGRFDERLGEAAVA